MRQQHGHTLQNSNLPHYLLSLQQPIIIRNYTCTDCRREFPNNHHYYTHRFLYHALNQANNMVQQVGGALLEGDDQLMSLVQHRRSSKVLMAVRKPKSMTMEWAGFLDDTLVSFSKALQQFVAREGARSITLSIEFTVQAVLLMVITVATRRCCMIPNDLTVVDTPPSFGRFRSDKHTVFPETYTGGPMRIYSRDCRW